jgi:hypothetical protein
MDIFIPPAEDDDLPVPPMGRDTTATIALKPHWETLIAAAPFNFGGASAALEVSPPLYRYVPGGYINQVIGECVAEATTNGVSTVLRIPPGCVFDTSDPAKSTPPLPTVRLSALYTYFNARNIHGQSQVGAEGAIVAYSLDGIKQRGVIPAAMWPDTAANQKAYSDQRPPTSDMLAAGQAHTVLHAARIQSQAQFLDFLAQGYPVVVGIPIGQGWMRCAPDGQFSLGGRIVGGHATLAVGYDRTLNRLYIRNSWAGWGARSNDPEFNSDDPTIGGNANGFTAVGYCALDQYQDMNLGADKFQSGETDAFVITAAPDGFSKPLITAVSNVRVFT